MTGTAHSYHIHFISYNFGSDFAWFNKCQEMRTLEIIMTKYSSFIIASLKEMYVPDVVIWQNSQSLNHNRTLAGIVLSCSD